MIASAILSNKSNPLKDLALCQVVSTGSNSAPILKIYFETNKNSNVDAYYGTEEILYYILFKIIGISVILNGSLNI